MSASTTFSTLDDASDFVWRTFFPRWQRDRWQFVEGEGDDGLDADGYCHRATRTVFIAPSVVKQGGDALVAMVAHEVCHAVTTGTHGDRFIARLRKAARDAEAAGYPELASRIALEADDYERAIEISPAYVQGIVDNVLVSHPSVTWETVRRVVADEVTGTEEYVDRKYPRLQKYFRERQAFYESWRRRLGTARASAAV